MLTTLKISISGEICPDKSGVFKDLDNNSSCGSQYRYGDVKWTWFKCQKNGKCIHNNTRCDMHPNPECVYENEHGELVAEDEEGCLEEYKRKGLVSRSANFLAFWPFKAITDD